MQLSLLHLHYECMCVCVFVEDNVYFRMYKSCVFRKLLQVLKYTLGYTIGIDRYVNSWLPSPIDRYKKKIKKRKVM